MALKQADRLEANNPKAYGIVKAIEISGHRSVLTPEKLTEISDCILSESGNNRGNDAIGQMWYVISESCYYLLVSWENRRNVNGWHRFNSAEQGLKAGDGIILEVDPITGEVTISADVIKDNLKTSTTKTWSIDKLKVVMSGRGLEFRDDQEILILIRD